MLTVTNPATEEVLHTLNASSPDEVGTAFKRARSAQSAWAALPYLQRAEVLTKFRNLLAADTDECAQMLSREMGKPAHQAAGEIKATLARLDWFLENTPRYLDKELVHVTPGMVEEISYEPLGVVANISAWNFPYFVGTNVIMPALLTGNAVLYKPSEFTSLSGLRLGTLLHKAGVPKDVFQVLIGGGEVGAELCRLPLGGMFFTGSLATGQRIAAAVGPRFIRMGLELGGKDGAYICADADIKQAAECVADGSFYNAGQSCCAVERIYVHETIYDSFLKHFEAFTRSLKVGDPSQADTYMGPLARQSQLAILEAQVQDALAKGARYLVQGGRRPGKGYYFEPSVLVGVNHSMTLMREESFGPIIGIQKVKDDAEALALMNDSAYGLTASVHTENKQHALNFMQQCDTGTVYWNCCDRVTPYLPWTGRKGSGIGSTLSHHGIKAFLQPKAWHLKHPATR